MPKFEVVTPDSKLVKTGYAKKIAEAFDLSPAMYDQKYSVSKADVTAAIQRESELYEGEGWD